MGKSLAPHYAYLVKAINLFKVMSASRATPAALIVTIAQNAMSVP